MDAYTPLESLPMTILRMPPELRGVAQLSMSGKQITQRDKGFHQLMDAAQEHARYWPAVAAWFREKFLEDSNSLRPGVLQRFVRDCPIEADRAWAQERLFVLRGIIPLLGSTFETTDHRAVETTKPPEDEPDGMEVTEPGFAGAPPAFFLIQFPLLRKSKT